MSELDAIIATAAKDLENSNDSVLKACERTLKDYQAIDDQDQGTQGGPRLRMIAWDHS